MVSVAPTGGRKPLTDLGIDDLPQPEGPSRTRQSDAATSISTRQIAVTICYREHS
jgi:hypothetical protein